MDGIYNHANLSSDGVGNLTPNSTGALKLYNNSEVTENIILSCNLNEGYDQFGINSAGIGIISDTNKDYVKGGSGWSGYGGELYDRVLAEGNCYVYANISTYVGETFEVKPFGTLTYKGVSEEYGYKTYTYQKEIKDKTIFNKDRIICVMN